VNEDPEKEDLSAFEGEQGRQNLMMIGLVSGALWLALGSIILYFSSDEPLLHAFHSSIHMWQELAYGLGFGLVLGFIAVGMMRSKAFQEATKDFLVLKVFRKAQLGFWDILGLSLIAGVTEEWLFRAALQPLLGLWIAALLFVAVHGYFRFNNISEILFGAFMMALSVGLGYLFAYAGLLAAIVAHTTYDVIVMSSLNKEAQTMNNRPPEL